MCAYEIGMILLGKFQSALKNFKYENVNKMYANFSVTQMYIMLTADFFIFLLLGYYLQNVVSHDFGIRRPFYFLCTPSYWGCKAKKNKKVLRLKDVDANKKTKTKVVSKEKLLPSPGEERDEENEENKEENQEIPMIQYENQDDFQSEEIYRTNLLTFFFEHTDEFFADSFSLCFLICYTL